MAEKKIKKLNKGEIVIYKTPDKKVQVNVSLDKETIWLNLNQIADLFSTDKSGISRHIKNVFKSGELNKNSTVAKNATVQNEGGREIERDIEFYNLDMILSVGYRVNSARATQFRIWATKTLKDHLVRGFTINEKRILEAKEKFEELKASINFLQEKSKHELLAGQEQEILNLLSDYSKTLTLLEQYDTEKVGLIKNGKGKFVLDYENTIKIIAGIKKDLSDKKEAGEFFGQENSDKLKAILGNILQTFDKKELYPSIEEKASHLLYFIIKGHPFIDGNKRIASVLFIYFLSKNNYLYKESGERKINDNALTALSLLIAISNMSEKDKLIKIVTNLIK
jgi:death-on-curing family protein